MASKRDVSGVLLFDKPIGLSSNSAVGRVKRFFDAAKAGHTGTLDPFATGLLPITLGEASKFSRFLLDAIKGYTAELKLGITTTTGDPEGKVVETSPVSVSQLQIEEVLSRFMGAQDQIPPMYSALKRDGVPLYKLARRGIEVERAPRRVTIDELALRTWDGRDRLVIDITCSKGTYIRVLAEDIGRELGCGAYLTALRRTRVGGFDVGRAWMPEALESLDQGGRDALLLPPEMLASDLPAVTVEEASTQALGNGRRLPWARSQSLGEHRVYSPAGVFMGICSLVEGAGETWLVPVRLMSVKAHAGPAKLYESA
jgi:tRNA pseudouridine55 synthase